jgi:flagellar biosynthesis protein FlhB|tara:strand:+ start:346 stop:594 length:249 start_codon:yes stop_codon:yes gene_type:complete
MKTLGVFIFLLGMFVFASGWMLLDLASMPLKNDLYSIDILGFFNNLFSSDPTVASLQSFMSVMFIIMGCLMAFSGAIMCDRI